MVIHFHLNHLVQHLKLDKIKAIGFSFGKNVLYQLALIESMTCKKTSHSIFKQLHKFAYKVNYMILNLKSLITKMKPIYKFSLATIFIFCFLLGCNKSESSIDETEIINQYFGFHPAFARTSCWALMPPCDSTYQTTIEIKDKNGSVTVKQDSSSFCIDFDFDSWSEEEQKLKYSFEDTYYSSGTLEFNTENDSFIISAGFGGSGGGMGWYFEGRAN